MTRLVPPSSHSSSRNEWERYTIPDFHQISRGDQNLKSVILYMPNGDEKNYPQVLNHNTENGLLAFRYEEVPGDRTTIKKIITNLPFRMDDDTV